ncbi:unnamed protein product [Cuscuta epithymum]|uniref:F-box domain-containing protein n=1 Tax=Cuscuta epithymum TaxID=186058 RepID=A0AAV0DCH0_9ASTE|nr:unnamed protein product [Cuscuta epithymum]
MATFHPSKTEMDGDRISQLPADVKDLIMECLDTRDAARVAVLSTQWKDVWLRHGRLVFNYRYFRRRRKPSTFINMDICDAALNLPEMIPTAINLQAMKLDDFSFGSAQHFFIASEMIKKCPKLCKLEIISNLACWIDDGASLWEDPVDGGFIIDHDLDMLKKVSIDSFFGYKREEIFVKAILSKSPVLEELVIRQSAKRGDSVASEFRNEMHCFPRASSKVCIVINYM